MAEPKTTSEAELKGPADPQKMDAETFEVVCRIKHQDMRGAAALNVRDLFEAWKAEGKPIEDLVVVLAHITEPMLTDETRVEMEARGYEVNCLSVDRKDFAVAVESFEHPNKGRIYENLAKSLRIQVSGHMYVCAMGFGNASLTRYKPEDVYVMVERREEVLRRREEAMAKDAELEAKEVRQRS